MSDCKRCRACKYGLFDDSVGYSDCDKVEDMTEEEWNEYEQNGTLDFCKYFEEIEDSEEIMEEKKMLRTVLINVENETAEEIEVEIDTFAFCEALDCECFDIVSRRIGGKAFDIMCDDEGLFRDPQKISAINDMGEPMFVGNLMIFKHDWEGNTLGLTEDEIEHVLRCVDVVATRDYPSGYPMLTQCEYIR